MKRRILSLLAAGVTVLSGLVATRSPPHPPAVGAGLDRPARTGSPRDRQAGRAAAIPPARRRPRCGGHRVRRTDHAHPTRQRCRVPHQPPAGQRGPRPGGERPAARGDCLGWTVRARLGGCCVVHPGPRLRRPGHRALHDPRRGRPYVQCGRSRGDREAGPDRGDRHRLVRVGHRRLGRGQLAEQRRCGQPDE